MKRREFLRAGLALPAATLAGCKLTLEQGLFSECRLPHRHPVFREARVLAAWQGLRADRVWDSHAHLFGNGRSKRGIWVNPDFDQPTGIAARVRRVMFVNGGCGGDDEAKLDEAVVVRLTHIVDELPAGAKVMLLAFDFTYGEDGRRREDLTTFAVSHEYVRRVVRIRPERFEWIASVHPYRADALEALAAAKAEGARAVKWLPPTMGIDLANARCRPFYEALVRLDLPLLVHVGEEQAVAGAGRHELGNPLFLRHPLEQGVRVIAAHCASLGESPDLDANANPDKAPAARNVDLFARIMADGRLGPRLAGDLSAITQANRIEALPTILAARGWHGRLLNGSDYPLPGIMPLFSLNAFVSAGLLEEAALPVLRELRHLNPLQFDFVLKRSLRLEGAGLPDSAFETRGFFDRAAA